MIRIAYVPDVVKRTTQLMTEFDPLFKIPDNFFPVTPEKTLAKGNEKPTRNTNGEDSLANGGGETVFHTSGHIPSDINGYSNGTNGHTIGKEVLV